MPRDIFGRLVKSDIFGRKISKKQIKREVIDENGGLVQFYKRSLIPSGDEIKKGNPNMLNVLIGGVMRKTQGKANAGLVRKILEKLLNG